MMRSLASAGMGGGARIGIARWRRCGGSLDRDVREASQTHECAELGRCVVASSARARFILRCVWRGRLPARINTNAKVIPALFLPFRSCFSGGACAGCYQVVAVRECPPCGFMNPHLRFRMTESQPETRSHLSDHRKKPSSPPPNTRPRLPFPRRQPALPPLGTHRPAPHGPPAVPEWFRMDMSAIFAGRDWRPGYARQRSRTRMRGLARSRGVTAPGVGPGAA